MLCTLSYHICTFFKYFCTVSNISVLFNVFVLFLIFLYCLPNILLIMHNLRSQGACRVSCAAQSLNIFVLIFNFQVKQARIWGEGEYITCPPKKCLWKGPKMPHECLKWPKMPCLRIHISYPALILDAPLWNQKSLTREPISRLESLRPTNMFLPDLIC